MPHWAMGFPWEVISRVAASKLLDPLLVGAFVSVESSGVAAATRYEKGYRWLSQPERHAKALGITFDTEVIAQSHSYGLLQIMGGTARGLGYVGYLSLLIEVERGLEWGCEYLAALRAKYTKLEDVIAAYNAGSPRDVAPLDGKVDNHEYVRKVLDRYLALKGNKPLT